MSSKPEGRYAIAGYYLDRRPGSPIFKAAWFDRETRQTRRVSLGTSDLREAEIRLAKFVIEHSTPRNEAPAAMPLATLFIRYWESHAKNLPSHKSAKLSLRHWLDHWGEATVADLTIERQEAFIASLKAKGYRNSFVSRVVSAGRAAVNRAWKRGEITAPPFIMDERDRSDAKEAYRLSKDEMRRLLTEAQRWPHLFTYCMIALNTLARPAAVLDLRPAQVDLEDRLIDMNPKGRKQNNKYRPTIPLTDTLLPFVRSRDAKRFVLWRGKIIASISKTFDICVSDAGLPRAITPYSLRHTMAVELRKRGVPAWEVEGLMGHKRPGVTEAYAKFSPDFMSKGREAIDAYFAELGLSYTVPAPACVSVTCHPAEDAQEDSAGNALFSAAFQADAAVKPINAGTPGTSPRTPISACASPVSAIMSA